MAELFTPLRYLLTMRRRELVSRVLRAEAEATQATAQAMLLGSETRVLKEAYDRQCAEWSLYGGAASIHGGAASILDERRRQIEAGWDAAHDDGHDRGELLSAARAYMRAHPEDWPWEWPWERAAWKPSEDPVRNLVKAGALIAAEIDRLRRANA